MYDATASANKGVDFRGYQDRQPFRLNSETKVAISKDLDSNSETERKARKTAMRTSRNMSGTYAPYREWSHPLQSLSGMYS